MTSGVSTSPTIHAICTALKTPSLRNIALTAPYFHDAQAKDLHQAVELMLKYQVGTQLPEQDINDIVAFLESLTGEYIPHS